MHDYKGLNIAITGGAGFIGSHLAENLLNLGASVIVVDNFLHGNKASHLIGHNQFTIQEADIRDTKAMLKLLKNKDMVFHLAAVVGVEETQLAPYEVLDVEIGGTVNLLNSAVTNNVKKFILGSSSEVYGDSKEAMKEDSILSPRSTYAVSKLVGEEYCKAFYHKYGLSYTILRYFNVYGPRQDERFVISRFIKQALNNETMRIYGDGEQTRDFTYIDDTIKVTLLAGISDKAIGEAINVGTKVPTSINELVLQISKVIHFSAELKSEHVDYDKTRPLAVEVYNRIADIDKTMKLFNYAPAVSLEEGLNKLLRLDKRFSTVG